MNEDMMDEIATMANRGLAAANPDLAIHSVPALQAAHDACDAMDTTVAKALEGFGYEIEWKKHPFLDLHLPNPKSISESVEDLVAKARDGDAKANSRLWAAHLYSISLDVHQRVCIPLKAAKEARDQNGGLTSDGFNPRMN